MPMSADGDAAPVGIPAGRSSARCRFFGKMPVVLALLEGPERWVITVERWCSPHRVLPDNTHVSGMLGCL